MTLDSLDLYMQDIQFYKVLSRADERTLFTQYQKNKTPALRDKIFHHNTKMVVHISHKYTSYGVDMMDLIQEGNIALLDAIEGYDLSRKVRFASFAWLVIKWRISDYATLSKAPIHFAAHLKNTRAGYDLMASFNFVSLDDKEGAFSNLLTSSVLLDDNVEGDYLRFLINRLKPADKFIMEKRLEDKTCEEISALVGITKQGVNLRIHKAIKQMQRWVRLEARGVHYGTQKRQERLQEYPRPQEVVQ